MGKTKENSGGGGRRHGLVRSKAAAKAGSIPGSTAQRRQRTRATAVPTSNRRACANKSKFIKDLPTDIQIALTTDAEIREAAEDDRVLAHLHDTKPAKARK